MMGDNTKIEWAQAGLGRGASWNPIRARDKASGRRGYHCTHVSEGCRFCYAERFNQRLGTGLAYKPGHEAQLHIYLDQGTLMEPMAWKTPRGIFVCSMSDAFGEWVPDAWIDMMVKVAVECARHRFLFLTKRGARMAAYSRAHALPANVWCGVSVEDQSSADERLPQLHATRAAIRFVSYEPALADVDFGPQLLGIDWLIGGGESGPEARSSSLGWHAHALAQCQASGTAYFEKQLGARPVRSAGGPHRISDAKGGKMDEWPRALRVREFPEAPS